MRFGPPMTPPIIKQLLIANLAVYIAQHSLVEVNQYGAIMPAEFWQLGYLWQPFTYMWMHTTHGFGHIAMRVTNRDLLQRDPLLAKKDRQAMVPDATLCA